MRAAHTAPRVPRAETARPAALPGNRLTGPNLVSRRSPHNLPRPGRRLGRAETCGSSAARPLLSAPRSEPQGPPAPAALRRTAPAGWSGMERAAAARRGGPLIGRRLRDPALLGAGGRAAGRCRRLLLLLPELKGVPRGCGDV